MADNFRNPNVREIALEGLRQALQARVAQIWTNITLPGEGNRAERFKEGYAKAVEAYELAWHAVDKASNHGQIK
jgi:hypothetical protein